MKNYLALPRSSIYIYDASTKFLRDHLCKNKNMVIVIARER